MPSSRPLLLALLLALTGCASSPPADDPAVGVEGRPFIKLAARNLGLVIQWRGPVAPKPYIEQLERRLARRLKTIYRTPVVTRRLLRPFDRLPPDLYLELVEKKVDDVIVAEFQTLDRPDGPLGVRAMVVTMTGMDVVLHTKIDRLASKRKGRPDAKTLADLLARKISHGWTDPGAAPPLDPILAADLLAERDACDHAVKLYDRYLDTSARGTITKMGSALESERRRQSCQRRIRVRDAIRADKTARFRVDVDGRAVAKPLAAAFERAVKKSRLPKVLARFTDKPVTIEVAPDQITVAMRFHEERYRDAISGRDRWIDEQPVVYIDPYVAVIDALLAYREAVLDEVPPYDRRTIRKMNTSLRLETLFGDYAAIDFADLDDRLLLTNTLRVRVGARAEIAVPSSEGRVTQTQRYVLGPPRDAEGALTAYGLVFEFFGLGKEPSR